MYQFSKIDTIIRLAQTKFHLVRGNFVSEYISYIIQPGPNLFYQCIMGKQSVRNPNLVTMTLSLTLAMLTSIISLLLVILLKLVPRTYLEHRITKLVLFICLIPNDGCINKQTMSIFFHFNDFQRIMCDYLFLLFPFQ